MDPEPGRSLGVARLVVDEQCLFWCGPDDIEGPLEDPRLGFDHSKATAVEAVSKETGPAEAVDHIRLRMGRVGEKGKPGASAGRCEQDPQGVGVEVEPAPNVGVDQVSQQRLVGQ